MRSYYEGLPIYRAAADLAVLLDRVVRNFSRYRKYGLGSRMREGATELVVLVARCNTKEERAQWLPVLCSKVEELKVLVNLGRELAAFQSFKQFVSVAEKVEVLARQAEGWRRSLSRSSAARPEPVRSHAGPVRT